MRRRFVTLDVFTLQRFCGNPLAVVFESQGLETSAMQAIAREFNYPETVFVLPPDDPAHRARLRIFTPAAELPFAGHPTVGSAVALARAGGGNQQSFTVLENVGPVACEVTLRDADSGEARFVIPRLPERVGAAPDRAQIAAALGLAATDIATDEFEPATWSAGVPFTFVPVRSLVAIGKAWPEPSLFERTFGSGGPAKVFAFCREAAAKDADFHARMFAPRMGIPEDPATGSAAAAFMGLYAASQKLTYGTHRLRIEQGIEMGRPSEIDLTLTIAQGNLTKGMIGGGAVVTCEGAIEA